jgi:hypothetical protein
VAGATTHYLNPDCNPWAGAGKCPAAPSTADCSRRVIIIPIIDQFGNGSSDDVTILRFGLFFLEGYANGSCSGGNACEIVGRFVRADISQNALTGSEYDPTALVHFTKLTE